MSARAALIVLLGGCLLVAPGCGTKAPEVVPANTSAAEAGANRRFQPPPGSEQLIGKNGRLLYKPGMKQPPANPSAGKAPGSNEAPKP